ncbi:flavin reductase (DIM6/NTAB) family NADH-FMN oxidoreductase RutF [Psychrobacillus insolitus]|uniref:Flavin reductase (DIM6/NTAB) family NADH-FMN oxidoreductase RutF n=1 Tax=Psychrobacillus insolitus TaxID=1461 RepID=A0A2W7N7J5_9BACI|nr:flavin reductase family protein [Psychrobacillus insolitus]PZX08013.1 flavin reductase (DIM6/NTAB) family NADH-FMN oxidoreductase RutF [Psychrobacillus insolitus]
MEDRLFRDAMGKFSTGVTVITTEFENAPHGMTANAFMSVSLDPKLVVVSIGHKARFLEKIKTSRKFAVNILADNQKEYSMTFAGQIKDEIDIKFETLAGLPVLPGALAQVSCEVVSEYVEGDHTLFIGKVLDIKLEEGNPLLFFGGRYHQLKELEVIQS